MRHFHWMERLVGLLFVAAAVLKAIDLPAFTTQIAFYGVLSEAALWRHAALLSIALETLLGIALLVGWRLRPLTFSATVAMLVGFTGLIAYGWIYHDLADCGCFGKVLPMGPRSSIAKNAVMILMIAAAWAARHRTETKTGGEDEHDAYSGLRKATALAACGAVALGVVFGDNAKFFNPVKIPRERPFAEFRFEFEGEQWDLSTGNYLVVLLTATCPHCQACVQVLNELSFFPETPQIVGLTFCDGEQELEWFRQDSEPLFPTTLIDGTTFFTLIEKEPPRFFLTGDGASLRSVEILDPDLERLLDFVRGTSSSGSGQPARVP